jgi:transcriptional regulator NrdR family protein
MTTLQRFGPSSSRERHGNVTSRKNHALQIRNRRISEKCYDCQTRFSEIEKSFQRIVPQKYSHRSIFGKPARVRHGNISQYFPILGKITGSVSNVWKTM